MELDANPGHLREFEVLVLLILLALLGGSMSDFLAPEAPTLVDTSRPIDSAGGGAGEFRGVLIEPWMPRL